MVTFRPKSPENQQPCGLRCENKDNDRKNTMCIDQVSNMFDDCVLTEITGVPSSDSRSIADDLKGVIYDGNVWIYPDKGEQTNLSVEQAKSHLVDFLDDVPMFNKTGYTLEYMECLYSFLVYRFV